MMIHHTGNGTLIKIILWQLSKCVFAFYSGCYLSTSIGHGAYKLQTFDAAAPFDFLTWIEITNCCTYSVQTKINLMSLVGGFLLMFLALVIGVRRAHWLFILIIDFIHLTISCIVMQSFPLSYSYWICLGIGSFLCLWSSDIIVFFMNEKNATPKVQPTSLLQTPRSNTNV